MRRWRANERQRARSSGGSTHRHAQAAATPPGVPPADLRLAVRARFFSLRRATAEVWHAWQDVAGRHLAVAEPPTQPNCTHRGGGLHIPPHCSRSRPYRPSHGRLSLSLSLSLFLSLSLSLCLSLQEQDQEIGALFVPWPPTAAGEPAQAREAVAPSQTKRVRGARMARACGRCYARYQIAFMPL